MKNALSFLLINTFSILAFAGGEGVCNKKVALLLQTRDRFLSQSMEACHITVSDMMQGLSNKKQNCLNTLESKKSQNFSIAIKYVESVLNKKGYTVLVGPSKELGMTEGSSDEKILNQETYFFGLDKVKRSGYAYIKTNVTDESSLAPRFDFYVAKLKSPWWDKISFNDFDQSWPAQIVKTIPSYSEPIKSKDLKQSFDSDVSYRHYLIAFMRAAEKFPSCQE